MKVAVVILNYNSADDCRKCVGFLKKQEGVELEIIIVDNASRTEDAKAVKALCEAEGATFIEAGSNRGYNAGNNVGLRHAADKGYDYALVANPDMEFPDPRYVLKLTEVLKADPETVMVGSDIVTPEGIHQNPKLRDPEDWRNYLGWIKGFIQPRKASKAEVPEWVDRPETSHECRCLNGCCFLIRMDFLEEVGFFDERTFLYGEEPILARTVELAGKRMMYLADTTAVHAHRKSREGVSSFNRRHWRRSQILYIREYSKLPFYGRWIAELSSRLYFAMLGLSHTLKGK